MSIRGKVVEVLNERELVINKGAEQEVQPDMIFTVMASPRQLIDPDTKELLGEWKREKIRVKIFEVHPRFSVGRTYETYQALENELPPLTNIAPPRIVTKVRKLRTDRPEVSEDSTSYVQVGDAVEQISEYAAANRVGLAYQ